MDNVTIAAIASAIAAVFSLLVSVVAIYLAHATLKHQRIHNILSVRPIPIVTVADFEQAIRVKIRNHGSGPLVITRVCVETGAEEKESLINCMPKLPPGIEWKNFTGPLISDRSLLPGSEIMLLELEGSKDDPVFVAARDTVRLMLARLSVLVSYTDLYQSSFPSYSKTLDWFGRHDKGEYPV